MPAGESGSATGAGFYCEDTDEEHTVNPMGIGLTNTVYRAELAGIWGWLTRYIESPKIFNLSDSLNSLRAVSNCVHRPWTLYFHKHKELIFDILRLLRDRSDRGFQTVLAKVRAHSNIWGNEKADELAKAAAHSPSICDIQCNVGVGSIPAKYWPYKVEGEEKYYLSNLS